MKLSNHRYWRWKAIDILGGTCVGCGCRDKRCLTLDHKEGDGYKRNGQNGYSAKFRSRRWRRGLTASEIQDLIESGKIYIGFQILCANCHSIKTFEQNEQTGVKRDSRLPLFDGVGKVSRFEKVDWEWQRKMDKEN